MHYFSGKGCSEFLESMHYCIGILTLSAQNMITEKTNELLTRNAETLKMATVETAKEAERSVVDIATLKRCNQQLISSISEVVKIHEQGARRRQDAETELVKVEQELKQALLEAGSK